MLVKELQQNNATDKKRVGIVWLGIRVYGKKGEMTWTSAATARSYLKRTLCHCAGVFFSSVAPHRILSAKEVAELIRQHETAGLLLYPPLVAD